MLTPLNIVIVGIGHSHAEGVVGELIIRKDLFKIIGYVEDDEKIFTEKQKLSTFSDLKRLNRNDVLQGVYKVDGIIIEEVMEKIIPTCIEFLSLGVPIHADKPTGLNDDFITYMNMAEERKIPVQIGYMYRYGAQIMELKKRLKDGIGDITQLDAAMDIDLSIANRKKIVQQSSSMYVYGSHILDLITSIAGFPDTVYSFLRRSGIDGLDIEDNCVAVLDYKKYCATLRTSAISANGYMRRHIVVAGTKGAISIEPMEKPIKMYYTPRKPGGNGGDGAIDLSTEINLAHYQFNRRYQFMMENFAYMIKGENEKLYVKVDYDYERKLHRLLLQILNNSY